MNELALFAGAGGGILGARILGWRTVAAVEINEYARRVLIARQNDGCLDPFPVWDDIRTFDARPLRERIDVVSGGFPCQDISNLGKKAGINGSRSGLWREYARIIDECRPAWVFAENVPALTRRGLGLVLADLTTLGYDSAWGVIGGDKVAAPTLRERLWVVAHTNGIGRVSRRPRAVAGQANPAGPKDVVVVARPREKPENAASRLLGMGHGMANRVDRLHAIGNGQLPDVAAFAWRVLSARLLT